MVYRADPRMSEELGADMVEEVEERGGGRVCERVRRGDGTCRREALVFRSLAFGLGEEGSWVGGRGVEGLLG